MEHDVSREITQWLGAAPGVLEGMSRLLDEHQRLRKQAEAAVRECATLREELASAHAANRRLVDAWLEIDQMIADGLGKANDAAERFRASLAAPIAAAPVAPPAPQAAPPAPQAAPSPVTTPAAPVAEPKEEGPRRILVADDDAYFRTMMEDFFTHKRGYEVHVATSGEDAVAALRRVEPHAMLLDLAMPGGGLWAIERIKACRPELCVIVVSASDDATLVAKTRALGAADYVAKPFDLDHLAAVLDRHITAHEAASTPDSPITAATGTVEKASQGPTNGASITGVSRGVEAVRESTRSSVALAS
jgi:CheY-like chemotaxis protein